MKRNIKIDIEQAREWYIGSDPTLRELATTAFSIEELSSFRDIKTIQDAVDLLGVHEEYCRILNTNIKQSIAAFEVSTIRKALNFNYPLHFDSGNIWYPLLRWSPADELDSSYIVGKLLINNKTILVGGGRAGIGGFAGLGFFNSDDDVGYATHDVGLLGCASKEIALHFCKYFGKLIWDSIYIDKFDYVWIE